MQNLDEKLREAVERGIVTPFQAEQLQQLWQEKTDASQPVVNSPPDPGLRGQARHGR